MENSNYRAVVDENHCYGKGDCIKVCEVKAIEEGPKRMPMVCGAVDLLPGKAILILVIVFATNKCRFSLITRFMSVQSLK